MDDVMCRGRFATLGCRAGGARDLAGLRGIRDAGPAPVFLIGVLTNGGGVSGEVARLKGEQEAVRRAMVQKRC